MDDSVVHRSLNLWMQKENKLTLSIEKGEA